MSFLRLIEMAERNLEEIQNHASAHIPSMLGGAGHSILVSKQKTLLSELKRQLAGLTEDKSTGVVTMEHHELDTSGNFSLIDEQIDEQEAAQTKRLEEAIKDSEVHNAF